MPTPNVTIRSVLSLPVSVVPLEVPVYVCKYIEHMRFSLIAYISRSVWLKKYGMQQYM